MVSLLRFCHNINNLKYSITIFSMKNRDIIRQNDRVVKNTHKHHVNLRKNSALYFQVGLILCLLTTYGLLEVKFQTN